MTSQLTKHKNYHSPLDCLRVLLVRQTLVAPYTSVLQAIWY